MSPRLFSLPLAAVLALTAGLALGAAAGPGEAQAGLSGAHVDAPPVQPQGKRVRIKVEAGAAQPVLVVARGRVWRGSRSFSLRRAVATVAAGRSATLTLRPKWRGAERRILRALRRGRSVQAQITVRLSDLLGNLVRRKISVTLTR